MGTLERRQLVKLGGSLIISLPPGWLAYYGLRAGDFVEVVTERKLVVKPMKQRRGNAGPQA